MSIINRKFSNNNVLYPLNDAVNVINDNRFNPELPTVLFVHGYNTAWTEEHITMISNAFNRLGTYNTLVLDYAYLTMHSFSNILDYVPAVKNV